MKIEMHKMSASKIKWASFFVCYKKKMISECQHFLVKGQIIKLFKNTIKI